MFSAASDSVMLCATVKARDDQHQLPHRAAERAAARRETAGGRGRSGCGARPTARTSERRPRCPVVVPGEVLELACAPHPRIACEMSSSPSYTLTNVWCCGSYGNITVETVIDAGGPCEQRSAACEPQRLAVGKRLGRRPRVDGQRAAVGRQRQPIAQELSRLRRPARRATAGSSSRSTGSMPRSCATSKTWTTTDTWMADGWRRTSTKLNGAGCAAAGELMPTSAATKAARESRLMARKGGNVPVTPRGNHHALDCRRPSNCRVCRASQTRNWRAPAGSLWRRAASSSVG